MNNTVLVLSLAIQAGNTLLLLGNRRIQHALASALLFFFLLYVSSLSIVSIFHFLPLWHLYAYRPWMKSDSSLKVIPKSPWFTIIAFAIVSMISWGALMFVKQGINSQNLPFHDTYYYAQIADFFTYSGLESSYPDQEAAFWGEEARPTPYHYPEIWLTHLLGRVTQQPMTVVFDYFVHTGLWVLLTGLAWLLVRRNEKDWFALVWIVGLSLYYPGIVKVSPLSYHPYVSWFFYSHGFNAVQFTGYISSVGGVKVLAIGVYAVFLYTQWNREPIHRWSALALAPFVSATLLPWVGLGFAYEALRVPHIRRWGQLILPNLSWIVGYAFLYVRIGANSHSAEAIVWPSLVKIGHVLCTNLFMAQSQYFLMTLPLLTWVALSKRSILWGLLPLGLIISLFSPVNSWGQIVFWAALFLLLSKKVKLWVLLMVACFVVGLSILQSFPQGTNFEQFFQRPVQIAVWVVVSVYGFRFVEKQSGLLSQFICLGLIGFLALNGVILARLEVKKNTPVGQAPNALLARVSERTTPVRTAYFAPFTQRHQLYNDAVGKEILTKTNLWATTCLSILDFSPAQQDSLLSTPGGSFFQSMPLVRYQNRQPSTLSRQHLIRRFLHEKQVEWLYRRHDYPFGKMAFLHNQIADSLSVPDLNYTVYFLKP